MSKELQEDDVQIEFTVALEQRLFERQRRDETKVESLYSRKQIEQGVLEAFDLIGGIPRLAIWANDPSNYGRFVEIWAKLAPKDTGNVEVDRVINYISNVPNSRLNRGIELIEEGLIVHDTTSH